MAISTRSASASAEPRAGRLAALHAEWGERVITAITASLAVLIVATIAVLMGMA